VANKEYSMLFKLQAQVGKEFGASFSKAQAEITATQREINALNKAQGDISAYQKQQQAVENTTRRLRDLQQQHDNIQREMEESGEYSSALANKMIDKDRAIEDATRKLANETAKLDEMDRALREAGVDTDHLGDESERLGAQMEELAKKNEAAKKEAEEYGLTGAEAFDAVGSALVAAGIVEGLKQLYEAYKECVNISAEFEATMSTVEALSGANAEELAALSEEAKRIGATTQYTATQAAEAMTYMGMAGWNAQQMLSGMNGVIQLASASGEDLATVSDIVTDNLTAFGMAADQTARFSDVLAAAATGSNTSVSIMGETFKKAAPVAGALGYSIEDVAVATGLMANAGVKGSRAGTALSNTFTGLLEGVTLTGDAIGEVEFTALNADGTMKTFRQTIESLREQFDLMTEAEKTNNAMAIAGKQGYAGLLAILNATDDDYNKLTNSINNCSGAAEKMAAIKLDNYKGQVTLLNSAMDALKTTVGDQFRPELTKLAKVATDIISGIQEFAEKNPIVVKSIMALTAEAGVLLGVYTAYTTVKKAKLALDKAGVALRALETAGTVKQAAAETAETAATVGATAAQNALNASMLANPVTWLIAGVAALTVGVIALTNAEKSEEAQARELTSASREQYEELKSLRAEHESAVAAYGENSEEAQLLAWQMERLSAEYEAGKQTVEEYREETKALADSLNESVTAYRDSVAELDRQEVSALALVHRLENLAAQVNRTTVEEGEMKAIVAELNELFPELNLSLEQVAQNQPDFMASIESMVQSEMAARKNKAAYDAMVDSLMEVDEAESKLGRARKDLSDAKLRAKDAQTAYEKLYGSTEGLSRLLSYLTPQWKEFTAATDEESAAQERVEKLTAAVDNANKTYASAQAELQAYYDSLTETETGEQALSETMDTVREKVAALTASYTEAYDAAYSSIHGQFALWDEAAEVADVSVSDINKALESQSQYWQDYQNNLAKLQAQADTVDGLREVIASFADGSNESVAAIAGMAHASEGDLKIMVANWKKVQDEQESVSDSLAQMTTDFSAQMADLQRELEEDVSKMDLSAEAAANGRATIDAFTEAAENSLPRVYAAYASVANAARSALNGGTASNGGSSTGRTGRVAVGGEAYAGGTDSATRGVHLVGEEGPELVYFAGGEKVLPASETKSVMSDAWQAYAPAGDVKLELTINVNGGDADGGIRAAGDALMDQLAGLLEDYIGERQRRAYR